MQVRGSKEKGEENWEEGMERVLGREVDGEREK